MGEEIYAQSETTPLQRSRPLVPIYSPSSRLLLFLLISFGYTWVVGAFVHYGLNQPYQTLVVASTPGPAIGAILTLYISGGTDVVKHFLGRALDWRFRPLLYLSALALPFLINGICSLAAMVLQDAPAPASWIALDFSPFFIVFFLLWNGLGEEIGWRGYALPILQEKYGNVVASLILGTFWACWHLPVFFIPGSNQYGTSFIEYAILLISWSLMMTLLHVGAKGSALVAIVYHEAHNLIAFSIRRPIGSGLYYYPVTIGFALASAYLLNRWRSTQQ